MALLNLEARVRNVFTVLFIGIGVGIGIGVDLFSIPIPIPTPIPSLFTASAPTHFKRVLRFRQISKLQLHLYRICPQLPVDPG